MHTKRAQWTAAAWILVSVLLGGTEARAQNFTTGTGGTSASRSGSSSSSGNGATLNNAPSFDPSAAATAALVGNYRVPGSAPLDPNLQYRVPGADTGGAPAPTTSSTTGTTNTTTSSGGSSGAASAGGASP